ncbi:MAG: hypothetical protein ACKOPP_07085 [Bacteroidota bacterium]
MNEIEQLNALIGSYLTANPEAENPIDSIYIFGVSGLIELLIIAENRPIEFRIEPDLLDGIFPYIDGKLVKLS